MPNHHLMPMDTAWAAALQVEDGLGGYGTFTTSSAGSEFVLPLSMDGSYRMALNLLGERTEVSILANGERYTVLSWEVSDTGWEFFVNASGGRQDQDEVYVRFFEDESHGKQLDVVVAGLTVSSWSERNAFARILAEPLTA